MKYLILILFLAGTGLKATASDAKDVILKMQAVYGKDVRMEYNATYELFKGHKSNTVENTYKGYVYRDKSSTYQKINETEFVYASDYFLKVNHEQKAMVLERAQKNINLDIDLDKSLKECSNVSMELVGNYYQVTLIFKPGSSSPFSVVKLRIDQKSYHLLQLDLYYTAQIDFSEDSRKPDYNQSHLKIKFTDIKINPKAKSQLFSLASYVKTSNNLMSPTGKCEGYQLTDNRK